MFSQFKADGNSSTRTPFNSRTRSLSNSQTTTTGSIHEHESTQLQTNDTISKLLSTSPVNPQLINSTSIRNSGSSHTLSSLLSNTPINSVVTNTDSILAHALPPILAAPTGWHSEIVQLDSSSSVNTNTDFVNTTNNYEEYNTTQTSYEQPEIIENNDNIDINQYLNASNYESSSQTILTDEEKRNMINTIEHQQPPPIIVNKTLPNNVVTYKQNVSIKYLQPPPLPPPGPIIIREVRPPQPPPKSPIRIRQRPPPAPTPPPIVLREQPPSAPPRIPTQVVEKVLPAPPAPPRRVVVERYGTCPPKPSDVIIERWLPYKQSTERRILLERAPPPVIQSQDPNLLILYDSPQAHIRREFINQGVVRADPDYYLQRYGADIHTRHVNFHSGHLVDEATRRIPPPIISSDYYHHDRYSSYIDDYERSRSPYISSSWERTRSISPIPRSPPYRYGYSSSYYDSPYNYCGESASRYGLNSYRYYDDYPTRRDSYLTMTDVTPTWNNYCHSSSSYYDRYSPSCHDRYIPSYHDRYLPSYYDRYSPSYYDRYASSYSPRTIRVNSDSEFHHVLSDLTNGHIPSRLRSYY